MLPPLNSRTKSHLTHNKRKSSKNKAGRFKIEFRNGRFVIPSADAWHIHWQEPYYLLLTIPWSGFFLFMVLSYMIVNTAFAIAYLMGGDCIANATPGAFGDVFFFSVQTISSIGYGSMYPTSVYANTVVTIEALTGGMGVALMTGLAFTKFSQPTARVIFSNVATISNYNGIPTLMFRAANQRRNQIIEAQMSAYLMQDEVSVEGEYMRRFYLLKLVRSQTPRFTLSWTIMHQIDEDSPLWGATRESLIESRAMLVVSLSGIDETVAQSIHAPYSYAAQNILWGHRFVDIVKPTSEGHHYIDFDGFNDTEPVNVN